MKHFSGPLKAIALISAGLSTSAATVAAPTPGSWHLNPTFGIQNQDSERELKDTYFWGAGVEYGVFERFSIELGYWRGKADEESLSWDDYFLNHWPDLTLYPRAAGDAEATFQEVRLDGIYHFRGLSWGMLTPYLVGGLGYAHFDYDTTSSVSDVRLLAGPGVGVQLSERWRLLADARAAYSFDNGEVDWLGRLALSFKVAGRAASEPTAAIEEPRFKEQEPVFLADDLVVEEPRVKEAATETGEPKARDHKPELLFEAKKDEEITDLSQIRRLNAEHLSRLPANAWTLQILSSSSEAAVDRFVQQQAASFPDLAYYHRRDARPSWVVIYGVFSSLSEAEAAKADLPATLTAAQPWPRRYINLGREISH